MRRKAEEGALLETAMKPGDETYRYPNNVAHCSCSVDRLRQTSITDLLGVAFDFSHPPTGALLYMIVIVLVSMTGDIAAGIGLAIIASLCLNCFFTEPRFSFQGNAVEDMVAVTAFALTAVTVAILVGRARRSGETVALKIGFKSSSTQFQQWSGVFRPAARPTF
jgi:hypothetical protein